MISRDCIYLKMIWIIMILFGELKMVLPVHLSQPIQSWPPLRWKTFAVLAAPHPQPCRGQRRNIPAVMVLRTSWIVWKRSFSEPPRFLAKFCDIFLEIFGLGSEKHGLYRRYCSPKVSMQPRCFHGLSIMFFLQYSCGNHLWFTHFNYKIKKRTSWTSLYSSLGTNITTLRQKWMWFQQTQQSETRTNPRKMTKKNKGGGTGSSVSQSQQSGSSARSVSPEEANPKVSIIFGPNVWHLIDENYHLQSLTCLHCTCKLFIVGCSRNLQNAAVKCDKCWSSLRSDGEDDSSDHGHWAETRLMGNDFRGQTCADMCIQASQYWSYILKIFKVYNHSIHPNLGTTWYNLVGVVRI